MPEQINPEEVDETQENQDAEQESELLTTVRTTAHAVVVLQVTVDTLLRLVRNLVLTATCFVLGYMLATLL